MPKQQLVLNNFSGGINSLKDPRDLANNELVQASNINIENQGIIKSSGVLKISKLASYDNALTSSTLLN